MDWCPPPYVKQSDPEPEKDSSAAHQDLKISSLQAKVRQLGKDYDSLTVHQGSEFTRLLTKTQQLEQESLDLRTAFQQAGSLAPSSAENVFFSQETSIQAETRAQIAEDAGKNRVDVQMIRRLPSTVTEMETKVYQRNKFFYVPALGKWSQIPWSFADLVALSIENGVLPDFWRIPHVMGFQEFQGYLWEFNTDIPDVRLGSDPGCQCLNRRDQSQFARILEATIRTGTRPLVSPDYFLFRGDQDRKDELKRMFKYRKDIPDLKWDLFTYTKKTEQHPDWPMFCRFVKTKVPTGKFLFKRERGDWAWLSRMIMEDGYLEVDREIVDFVQSFGGRLRLPKRRFLRTTKWAADDLLEIKFIVNRCWLQWRQETKQKLAETESPGTA